MALPASFIQSGFTPLDTVVKSRRLMIGSDGPPDSGKTEFILSCPDPGIILALDRGIDGPLRNATPPKSRRSNFAVRVVQVPMATQASQPEYLKAWRENFYPFYTSALQNPQALTVAIDGDSDSWELQRLASFGKLTQVPPIMYTEVNAARRAMYARAWDSGKIVIFTNKIKKEYKPVLNPDGSQKMSDSGKEVREFTGNYERQGFPDQEYLFQIQLSHMYRPARTIGKVEIPAMFGIRINKCKTNMGLIGTELWGDDCCFAGLVQTVYPQIPLEQWGIK